jgi:hypothetical protein
MFSSSGVEVSCGSRGFNSHLWLFLSLHSHSSSLTSIFMEGNQCLDGGVKQYGIAVCYIEVKRAPVKLTWSYIVAKC